MNIKLSFIVLAIIFILASIDLDKLNTFGLICFAVVGAFTISSAISLAVMDSLNKRKLRKGL